MPTEQFDPMQHDAGDYDPEPAGPTSRSRRTPRARRTEEPAAGEPITPEPVAEEPVEEPEEESHWPFSDPDGTGEQPAVEEPAQQPAQQPDARTGNAGDAVGPGPGQRLRAAAGTQQPLRRRRAPRPAARRAAPPFDDHDGHTVAGGWDPNQFARQQPGIPGQPQAPERHRPRGRPAGVLQRRDRRRRPGGR